MGAARTSVVALLCAFAATGTKAISTSRRLNYQVTTHPDPDCGWLNDKCCNFDPADYTSGTCHEVGSICWEGTCMPCGINGKPACKSGPKCGDCCEVNREGWCSQKSGVPHEPDPKPTPTTDPEPEGECGWLKEKCCDIKPGNPNEGTCTEDGTICWEGTCMPCGINGKPACLTGPKCKSCCELNKEGWCSLSSHVPEPKPEPKPEPEPIPEPEGECGWLDEKCCDIKPGNPNNGTCVEDGTICWEGTCMPCGINGKPACLSALPLRQLLLQDSNQC